MEAIDELREKALEAQTALYEAEAIQRDKRNAQMIGKCFKYHNSSSGWAERWWLYMQITKAENGSLLGQQFQLIPRSDGRQEIRIEQSYHYEGRLLAGFSEISYEELRGAWDAMVAVVVNSLAPTHPAS